MSIIFLYILISLIAWTILAVYLVINNKRIALLKDQPLLLTKEHPVAVIIAVRNEEADLREALESVCWLRYEPIRIIVVNDRSTDNTATILQQVAEIYPQIHIVTIAELPPKWLGKTHALYQGAIQTNEEWLLFTDADVHFHPDALNKAMHYAVSNNLDHLTVLPEINSRSSALNSAMVTFRTMLELKLRPWEVRSSKSSASIGVGAFNLVRRKAYETIGTHERIRLKPDDDLQLGQVIKQSGLRQDVLYGAEQVQLEWYTSIRQFIQGLMKNIYASFNYRLSQAILAISGTLFVFVLPVPLGLLSGDKLTMLMALLILVVQLAFSRIRDHKIKWWYGLTFPLAGALMIYVITKATILTLTQKGIYWRDHFYSLDELRAGK